MQNPNFKLLSYKEKALLKLIIERGSIYPQDYKIIYSSVTNAKSALHRLQVLDFIEFDVNKQQFIYKAYKEEEQKELEVKK